MMCGHHTKTDNRWWFWGAWGPVTRLRLMRTVRQFSMMTGRLREASGVLALGSEGCWADSSSMAWE